MLQPLSAGRLGEPGMLGTASSLVSSASWRIRLLWEVCVDRLSVWRGIHNVGDRLRQCLDRLVDHNLQILHLSVPGQGDAVWANFRSQLAVPLVGAVAQVLHDPTDIALQRGPNPALLGDPAWCADFVRKPMTASDTQPTAFEMVRPSEWPGLLRNQTTAAGHLLRI